MSNRSIKELTCIVCPKGCSLKAAMENNTVLSVEGNACPRGADYATKEITDPRRMVTSIVSVTGGRLPVVSVRTTEPISKAKIMECMEILKGIKVSAPVSIGQVIYKNIAGTEADIIATKNIDKKPEIYNP